MSNKYNKQEFELFKKECEKWKDIFGLHNWRIAYKWDVNERNLASCITSLEGYVATIFFPKDKTNTKGDSIKTTALHEMLHVLLGRFSENAQARHATLEELGESEEEIIRTLEYALKTKLKIKI